MNHRGTTLLEMMTAVAIIAVLASLASVNLMRQRSAGRSREATRLLVTHLRNARSLAVTSGLRHGIFMGAANASSFPAFQRRIVLYRKTVPDGVTVPRRFQVGDLPITTTGFPVVGRGSPLEQLQLQVDWTGIYVPPLTPVDAIDISFDQDGRPNLVVYSGNVANDMTAPLNTGPRRLLVRLSDPKEDQGPAGCGTNSIPCFNATSRCTGMMSTGTTQNYHGDATRPECI